MMKLNCLIKNMGRSIIPGLCLVTFAFGMDDNREDQATYRSVKTIMEQHLANNQGILDSSKGKDIVVFLGNTGAGKSTVINYLSNKELVIDGSDIVLKNPNDPSAMVIGEGADSETSLPRCIQVGDLLFYDMPGFDDTRGTARNLVNACFIKSIIENANSVRLVFVAGADEIIAKRGDNFKNLLISAKQLIPNKPIENFSALIITRIAPEEILLDFLAKKLKLTDPDLSILSNWKDDERIDEISKPMDRKINYGNRERILKLIGNMGHEQIEGINIGVIYDASQQMEIKEIYDAEIEDIIEKLISQSFPVGELSSLDKGILENKKNYIVNDFIA